MKPKQEITSLIAQAWERIADEAYLIQTLVGSGKYDNQFVEDNDKRCRTDALLDDIYTAAIFLASDANECQKKILNYEVREDIASEYGWKLDRDGKMKFHE